MSSQITVHNTEAAILGRVIELDEDQLTPEVARFLLSMKLPRADEERVNTLSAKARSASLSASDAQELDSYLHVGTLLSALQSKARRFLKSESSTNQ